MSVAIRGSSGGSITTSSQSVTLPVTTNVGDCILVVVTAGGGSAAWTVSGAGATWSQIGQSTSAPDASLWIGYNCSASQTAITVSETGATLSGGYDVLVASGLLTSSTPVASSTVVTWSTTSGTSSSLSYSAGQLLICGTATYGGTSDTVVWSSGESDQAVGINGSTRMVDLHWALPTDTNSTTATITWNGSGTGAVVAILQAVSVAAESIVMLV